MAVDVTLTEVGEFGLGDGEIETLLTKEELRRFMEIISDSFVPVSIHDIFSCGDERPGEGTLASSERTAPRPKLFGGLMAIYGGLLLIDDKFGKDYVAEMKWLDELMEQHDFHMGGHTDTSNVEKAQKFVEAVKSGKDVEPLMKSACGMVDGIETSYVKMKTYGHTAAYMRLVKALRGQDFDPAMSEKVLAGSERLAGTIPGPMSNWRGGNKLAALAHKPERVEVLTDDGLGVKGHRGALIVVNSKYETTLDRRQVADKVAADDLLRVKKPNAFTIDAWSIPELTMPVAEYLSASGADVASNHTLMQESVTQLQIATGITLTKGTQRVVVAS